jgi:hypothetical protein
MADVPTPGAPTVIIVSHHYIAQGWTPPLVSHRRRPCESLLHADPRLGLLLCYDASFCLLIRRGPHLVRIWRPLSCIGSFLPGRGSWTAEKVLSSCGWKGWRPLHAHLGRCVWNVTLVSPMPTLLSETSSSRCVPLVPSPNHSLTLVGRWRDARFFSNYR